MHQGVETTQEAEGENSQPIEERERCRDKEVRAKYMEVLANGKVEQVTS